MDPSYKKKRDAIYKGVELKSVEPKPTRLEEHYASLGADRNRENVYQEVQIVKEPQPVMPATTKRGKKPSTGCNYLWAVALVAMVASILAIVGVIIVAGVYVSVLQENTAMLMRQIVELKNELNQTQEFGTTVNDKLNSLQNTTTEQLNNLQSSLNTDRDRTMAQLSSLQSSVNTLNTAKNTATSQLSSLQSSVNTLNTAKNTATAQLSSLQSSVNTLNTAKNTATAQLSSLQSSVNTLNTAKNTATTRLSSLQSSVNTLTSRVNSPVNLYQNCIEETRSCTSRMSGSSYYKICNTQSLFANRSGYYTLDMSCKYDVISTNFDTAVLRRSSNGAYHCNCVVTTIPSPATGSHPSHSFPTFTCTLVVTRCPLSNRLY